MYLYDGFLKICETGQFKGKPETGHFLSGNFFSTKCGNFDNKFDGTIINIADQHLNHLLYNITEEMTTFTNFTEEMTTKKATVKISQKNKFLRDQKIHS